MIILKLGGSVITRKEAENPTLNHENLERIAREISQSNYQKLIVVHGAGSFGHPFAQKYGIGDEIGNYQDLENKMMGFSITQQAVKELNSRVCQCLRKYNILSVSIQPSSFILTKNKRIISANLNLIRKYLDLGFVPVLYGDVVLDSEDAIKMAVLSGDQIVKYLAENLKPKRVILGTDVDGIFNKDPKKYADAQLLDVVSSLDHMENGDTDTADVTGGMGGKLRELLELADIGVESEIINVNHSNIIKKALNGENIMGTLIKKKIRR